MQVVRFVTMDDKKVTCWCETNILKTFRDFMQYILCHFAHPIAKNPQDYYSYQVYIA